eukprot:9496555-Pyramimonas_sp.AAC.1
MQRSAVGPWPLLARGSRFGSIAPRAPGLCLRRPALAARFYRRGRSRQLARVLRRRWGRGRNRPRGAPQKIRHAA